MEDPEERWPAGDRQAGRQGVLAEQLNPGSRAVRCWQDPSLECWAEAGAQGGQQGEPRGLGEEPCPGISSIQLRASPGQDSCLSSHLQSWD